MVSVHGVYLFYHLHGLGDRTDGDDEQFIFPLPVRTSSLLFVLDLADVLMPCLLKALSLLWLSTRHT
jgi:hypothetical protein